MTRSGRRRLPVWPPAGWFPDPAGTPSLRYWDGHRWTEHQARQRSSPSREPFTTLPIAAAIAGPDRDRRVAHRQQVRRRVAGRLRWPIAVYVVIAGAHRLRAARRVLPVRRPRWGTGSMRRDLGFRFKPVDLGWGPLTWLTCFAAQIVVAVIILALKIPLVNNTEGISKLSGNRAYIISFAILAVVAAPIVEELIFRGVILRGFASAMPPWLSIGLQGILFGAAHIDPIRGTGNIGLVMILSTVGIVLGGAAYLIRRLAPTMISHALTNTIAVIFTSRVEQPVVDQTHVAEPHRDRCQHRPRASSTGSSVSGSTRSRWSRRASGSAAMTSAPARIRSAIRRARGRRAAATASSAAGTHPCSRPLRRRRGLALRLDIASPSGSRTVGRPTISIPMSRSSDHPADDGELLEVLLPEHRDVGSTALNSLATTVVTPRKWPGRLAPSSGSASAPGRRASRSRPGTSPPPSARRRRRRLASRHRRGRRRRSAGSGRSRRAG